MTQPLPPWTQPRFCSWRLLPLRPFEQRHARGPPVMPGIAPLHPEECACTVNVSNPLLFREPTYSFSRNGSILPQEITAAPEITAEFLNVFETMAMNEREMLLPMRPKAAFNALAIPLRPYTLLYSIVALTCSTQQDTVFCLMCVPQLRRAIKFSLLWNLRYWLQITQPSSNEHFFVGVRHCRRTLISIVVSHHT